MGAVLIWAAVLGVVVFLLMPAGPAHDRSKPLSLVRDRTPRLSIMRPGASLRVQHDGSGRSFSFRKGDDSGRIEQTIDFIFAESEWSAREFERVTAALDGAPFVSAMQIEGTNSTRVLRCSLTGRPISMGVLSGELLARVGPQLDFGDNDRFSLRLTGLENYAIWRRMNEDSFHEMAGERRPWLTRVFGRYQLRKLNKESRKPPRAGA